MNSNIDNRNKNIDLFKGILIVFMIISHILQLLFFPYYNLTLTILVNLIAFPGFMFAFGYVTYLAYLAKDIDKKIFRKKMIKRFCITMIAMYISSFAYMYFIENSLSLKEIFKIVFLIKIPGYSEFLLSFAFIYLFIYLFKDILKKTNKQILICFVLLSLFMTGINYELVGNNIIGLIIGTKNFYCFPIIQYFCYYVLGLYIAKNKIIFNGYICFLSFLSALVFVIYTIINNNLPTRFPPSIYWILGGSFGVYLLYLFCNKINENKIIIYIQNIGKNTLSYLVISNIVIFIFKGLMNNYNILFTANWAIFFITLFIFLLCMIFSYLFLRIISLKKYLSSTSFK